MTYEQFKQKRQGEIVSTNELRRRIRKRMLENPVWKFRPYFGFWRQPKRKDYSCLGNYRAEYHLIPRFTLKLDVSVNDEALNYGILWFDRDFIVRIEFWDAQLTFCLYVNKQ
jgi:hypothetical protein